MRLDQTRPDRAAGGGGQGLLAVLGGAVLVLALAGVAWALRSGDSSTVPVAVGAPITTTSGPPLGFIGPRPMGRLGPAAVTPTAIAPVATPRATGSSPAKVSPLVTPTAPAALPGSRGPAAPAAGSKGAGAPVAYHFSVKPGDTMWQLTALALRKTGRSSSPTTVASYLTRFYAHNTSTVGADPNVIQPGQDLLWPQGL